MDGVIQLLLDLGAAVYLPILVFCAALVLRIRVGRAFRSSVLVGVAFFGVTLILAFLFDTLGPVVTTMSSRFGIDRMTIDVGWPATATLAVGADTTSLVVPAALVLNIVLLLLKITRTINTDLWNYWHVAFVAAVVHVATGNRGYAVISALLFSAVVLFLADWTAPAIQQLLDIPGISLPHGFAAPFVVPAALINRALDGVPGFNRLWLQPGTVRTRLGLISDSMVQGFAVGFVVSLAAYAGSGPVLVWTGQVLHTAMALAAVVVLMPRVVSLLVEGLIPLSEALREVMQRRARGRRVYIGLDAAVAIGHPAAISTALLMVPITLALAVVLPANRVLPFADLSTIPFMVCMIIPVTRGSVVRSTIVASLIMVPTLYIMNALASIQTRIGYATNFDFPPGVVRITSLSDGGSWLVGAFAWAAESFWLGNTIILLALVVAWFLFRRYPAGWYRFAGYRASTTDQGAQL